MNLPRMPYAEAKVRSIAEWSQYCYPGKSDHWHAVHNKALKQFLLNGDRGDGFYRCPELNKSFKVNINCTGIEEVGTGIQFVMDSNAYIGPF